MMTEQPQTIEELVSSVAQTQRNMQKSVIPTIYGRLPEALPTNLRTIFRNATEQALAASLGLNDVPPGTPLVTSGQTDIWYIQNDPDNVYQNLDNIIVNIAERSR